DGGHVPVRAGLPDRRPRLRQRRRVGARAGAHRGRPAAAGARAGGRGVTAPGTTTISGARAPALPPAVLRRRGQTGRPPAGSGRVRRRAADAAAHLALLLLASVTLAPVAWMV